MTLFAFDTETYLLAPGMQAPPVVCLQFQADDQHAELIHARDPACYRTLRYALETPGVLWSGHNTAFDTTAIAASWPDLFGPILDLYERDSIVCTIARQKLIDIAQGTFKTQSKRGYDLGTVGARHDVQVDKTDPYRLRYGELYHTPVAKWPEEARRYALLDAVAQRVVTLSQESYADAHSVPLTDQFRQTRSSAWIHAMACWGLRIDPVRAREYLDNVRAGLEIDREICQQHGLVDAKGKRNTKPAMQRMVALCEASGAPDIPLTESGEEAVLAFFKARGIKAKKLSELPDGATYEWWRSVQHSEKLIEGIAVNEDAVILYGDEVLESYQRYTTATAQLARAQKLYVAALAGKPIQARFTALQDSGRTSCSQGDHKGTGAPSAFGAQLHNPAKDKKVTRKDGTTFVRKGTREMMVAREGHAFLTTDWEGAEASGVAQVCIWTPGVGFSRMAEVINAGGNLPTEFGAMIQGISREEAYAIRKAGGEGKKKFDAGPRQAAKIALYGYFANMGAAKLQLQARKQYRVDMTLEEAQRYKDLLKVFAPELPLFWEWGQHMLDTPTGKIDQFGRPERVCSRFTQFWSGRVRGMLHYAELLNTTFQGLVADLFKLAGWRLYKEMYTGRYWDDRGGKSPLFSCRKVNAPHDDFLVECPLDILHEAGQRQAEVMRETTREVCPDVDFRVEPAACVRWYKDAEPRFENGRLIPWEPS